MKIEILDSRRLTGPNLFWDWPGAVLDISVCDIPADLVISTWSEEVACLMDAMGWDGRNIRSRKFDGGASLVINAPIDVLYTACELNEVALNRTIAWLSNESLPDLAQVTADLNKQLAEERNPALLALQQTATDHHVPFLWDDDEVSVGFGNTAIVWQTRQLPEPESINWPAVGSIPLGIVTGTNGKSTTVRLAAAILAAAGLRAGITSTDYIRVGKEILDHGDYSGPGGARTLLRHPQSEAVVLEVARGGLLRRGIGVERADGALITNIAADHLGDYGINTVAEMAEAKFIVRRALSADAPLILNADDPESIRYAHTLSNHVMWFGLNADEGMLRQHLKSNGGAAFLADGWLVLAADGETRKIAEVKDIPITFGGIARYNISNALGAMALCHVLGADDQALAAGLKAFSGDADINPGRGNLFEQDGIRIFLDFAHNEHGVRAISDTVRAFHAKRNIVLMGQAGDRLNKDIDDLVRAVCELKPERLLACELPGYERGRSPMEVPARIRDVATGEGMPEDAVTMFTSPLEGVKDALADATQGDCLVLLALTQRDEVLALIRAFVTDD
ncbi:MAG: Mur ligase family protein [Gammaproteobacteria bacterium]|nr:MAG: Mur ligase family protein [Gammaproteobacteria bacterium]